MARYSLEETTLTNIANAIRSKTGKSESIEVQAWAAEIRSISGSSSGSSSSGSSSSGSGDIIPVEPVIEALSITKNGTYTAPSGVDGYSPVKVNVPIPDGYIMPSGTKSITANGTHDAKAFESVSVNVPIPEGYIKPSGTKSITANGKHTVTSYNEVDVNVPIPDGYIKPSGSIQITSNGTYDVTQKSSAVVAIPEKTVTLQNITIKENGTYSADSGYDGLGQVTVEISGGINTESEEVAGLLSNTMEVLDNSLVTTLRTRVCQAATKLITVNLPNVTSLGAYAFYQCSNLKTVTLPKLTSISTQTWYMCPKLEHADCGQLNSITAQTFASCTALKALILRKTSGICTLSNANGVSGSGIGKGTGYVYVPASLIETYKTSTNWSTVANQFRAIEDYPDICGG